jgi:hypothetical protein
MQHGLLERQAAAMEVDHYLRVLEVLSPRK